MADRTSRPAPRYATLGQIIRALDPALVALALGAPLHIGTSTSSCYVAEPNAPIKPGKWSTQTSTSAHHRHSHGPCVGQRDPASLRTVSVPQRPAYSPSGRLRCISRVRPPVRLVPALLLTTKRAAGSPQCSPGGLVLRGTRTTSEPPARGPQDAPRRRPATGENPGAGQWLRLPGEYLGRLRPGAPGLWPPRENIHVRNEKSAGQSI
jgi:hypothetical protein